MFQLKEHIPVIPGRYVLLEHAGANQKPEERQVREQEAHQSGL